MKRPNDKKLNARLRLPIGQDERESLSEKPAQPHYPILVLAQSQATPFLLKSRLAKYGFDIIHMENTGEIFKQNPDENPKLLVVEYSTHHSEDDLGELFDLCRSKFGDIQFALTYTGHQSVSFAELYRRGLQFSFQIPFEEEVLFNKIFELHEDIEIPAKELELDVLSRVFLPELGDMKELPFDVFVYLPRNQRAIRYGKKGNEIDHKLREKFGREINDSPLYVRKNDLSLYRRHFVKQLKQIGENTKLSMNQQKEKLRQELSRFISGIFHQKELSPPEAQAMLAVVRNASLDYLRETTSNKEIFDRIHALCSECSSNYNHTINTAIYSALFAMLMGYGNSQDFVMGGLLHDIGLSLIDPKIVQKPVHEMTEEEFDVYKQHPEFSAELIAQKKIPASSMVMKMILQHHERPDGSGYPIGEKDEDIHEFARICAIADVFDDLTSVAAGKSVLAPREALRTIAGLSGGEPLAGFDMKLHQKLIAVLDEEGADIVAA